MHSPSNNFHKMGGLNFELKNGKKYIEPSYLGTVKIISSWSGAWRPQRTLAIDKVVSQHAVAQSDHFSAIPALDYLHDRIWGLDLTHSLPA